MESCSRAHLMSLANLTRAGSNFKLAQVIQESIWLTLCFSPLLFYSVATQRDLQLPWNVFLLLVIKHLILWVADYSLYADVCSSTNSDYQTLWRLYFTVSDFFFSLSNFLPIFPREAAQEKQIKRNLTSVTDKYIIVCSSVFCTV